MDIDVPDIFGEEHPKALGSFNCPVCGRFSTVLATVRDDSPMSGEVPAWAVIVMCKQHGERRTG